MNISFMKRYWWAFPLLGLIVWAGLYYYLKSTLGKKMETVRDAKTDKKNFTDGVKAEDITAEPVSQNGQENGLQ